MILRNAQLLQNGIAKSRSPSEGPNALDKQPMKSDRDQHGRRLTLSVANHRKESMSFETQMVRIVDPLMANPSTIDPGVQALILMMQRIHSELSFVVRRMQKDDVDSDHISDWKFAAMAVDRLCLIVFSVFIIGTSLAILLSAPHLFA